MKKTINQYDFERAFSDMGRKDQFTFKGKKALFEYLESLEEDTGEQVELDVIALCCDYAEYDSALDCANEYDFEVDPDQDDEEQEESALDYLRYRTSVIEFDGGVIIQQF